MTDAAGGHRDEADPEAVDRDAAVARAEQRIADARIRLAAAEHRLAETLDQIGRCTDERRVARLRSEADLHAAALAVHREAIEEQRRHVAHLTGPRAEPEIEGPGI